VVINMHLAFNLVVAFAALPFLKPLVRVAEAAMPRRPDPAAAAGLMTALAPAALTHPDRALSCAVREIMHMGEITETMLRSVEAIYHKWDKDTADQIMARAASVRFMHFELKLYLARLHRTDLDKATADRSLHMSTVAVNMDGAADMIARHMVHLARRLDAEGLTFSEQGTAEIGDFHDRVQANAQLALSVMMTSNPAEARELVAQKENVRTIEQNLQRQHLRRLQEGRIESIETSNIHQETLRAMKFVNTAFSMVVHPILLESGDPLKSRLAEKV
jgi:phosphate:Na+ symporter